MKTLKFLMLVLMFVFTTNTLYSKDISQTELNNIIKTIKCLGSENKNLVTLVHKVVKENANLTSGASFGFNVLLWLPNFV